MATDRWVAMKLSFKNPGEELYELGTYVDLSDPIISPTKFDKFLMGEVWDAFQECLNSALEDREIGRINERQPKH